MGGGSSKAGGGLEAETAEFKKAQRRISAMAAPMGPLLVSPRGQRDPTATPPSSPYASLHTQAFARAEVQHEDSLEVQSLDDDESLDEQSLGNDSPTPLDLQSMSAEDDLQYVSADADTGSNHLQTFVDGVGEAPVSNAEVYAAMAAPEAGSFRPLPFTFASAPRPRAIVTREESLRVSPVTSPRPSQLSASHPVEGRTLARALAEAGAQPAAAPRAQTPPRTSEAHVREAADYHAALAAQWQRAEAAADPRGADPAPVQRSAPQETLRTLGQFGTGAYAEATGSLEKRSPRVLLPAVAGLSGRPVVDLGLWAAAEDKCEDGGDVHRRRQLRVAAALENMQVHTPRTPQPHIGPLTPSPPTSLPLHPLPSPMHSWSARCRS